MARDAGARRRMTRIDELRIKLELLIQQKLLVEQRLQPIKPQIEQTTKGLRSNEVTDGHIKRLRKLDEKREALNAQRAQIEDDIYTVKSELLELERINRNSYSGKMFCMEFVEVAKEKLPPELYRHIKNEAIRRGRG
jgi:chaperonin cofactor prefoldin